MIRARRAVDWRLAALALGLVAALSVFGRIAGTDPDEEYALASTAHGLGYALHRAFYYELQAPVWFGLVALWRGLDPSVAFARLFSILCATATCFALRAIALRLRPRLDPLPFVALVALNPFFIYAALEVRVYAFAARAFASRCSRCSASTPSITLVSRCSAASRPCSWRAASPRCARF
jgi:hypothetical protein